MTAEIKRVALEHLARDGSALSLRAVARDMGMVSSALYRYFPNRDELLTALIIDAYDGLGAAAEAADVAGGTDYAARWCAVGRGIREWAVSRPHEYALIYGSPIPGYAAPQDTVEPAGRPVAVLARIVAEAWAAGRIRRGGSGGSGAAVSATLEPELQQITDFLATATDPATTARYLAAMTQLFGALNFELFGRLTNVFEERAAWFDWQLRSMTEYVGLETEEESA
jgi:AcrR family transcriptional regulator